MYNVNTDDLVDGWCDRTSELLKGIYKIITKDGPLKDRDKPFSVELIKNELELIVAEGHPDAFYSIHVYYFGKEVLSVFVMNSREIRLGINNFQNGWWANEIRKFF